MVVRQSIPVFNEEKAQNATMLLFSTTWIQPTHHSNVSLRSVQMTTFLFLASGCFIVLTFVSTNHQVLGQNATIAASVAVPSPPTTNVAPTMDSAPTSSPTFSECVSDDSNDSLFRNSSLQGYATIYGNDTLILPPPSTLRIVEYVVDTPINGVLKFNSTDYSFIYKPNPSFVGTDLFAIDQCLYKSEDDDSTDAVCDCRYFDVVINILLPIPMSMNETQITTNNENNNIENSSDGGSRAIYALTVLALLPICCLISLCHRRKSTNVPDESRRDGDDTAGARDDYYMNDVHNDSLDDTQQPYDDNENHTGDSNLQTNNNSSSKECVTFQNIQQQDVEHHPMDDKMVSVTGPNI